MDPPNAEFVGAVAKALPPNEGVCVVPNEEVPPPNAGAVDVVPALPPNNPPPREAPPPPNVLKAGIVVEELPKDDDGVAAPNAPVEVALKPEVDPKLVGYRYKKQKISKKHVKKI